MSLKLLPAFFAALDLSLSRQPRIIYFIAAFCGLLVRRLSTCPSVVCQLSVCLSVVCLSVVCLYVSCMAVCQLSVSCLSIVCLFALYIYMYMVGLSSACDF